MSDVVTDGMPKVEGVEPLRSSEHMGKLSWLLWAGGKVAEKTLESLAMSFALWQRFPGWLGVFFSRHVFQKNKLMPFWVREEI